VRVRRAHARHVGCLSILYLLIRIPLWCDVRFVVWVLFTRWIGRCCFRNLPSSHRDESGVLFWIQSKKCALSYFGTRLHGSWARVIASRSAGALPALQAPLPPHASRQRSVPQVSSTGGRQEYLPQQQCETDCSITGQHLHFIPKPISHRLFLV